MVCFLNDNEVYNIPHFSGNESRKRKKPFISNPNTRAYGCEKRFPKKNPYSV
jgi:hypothetical protein